MSYPSPDDPASALSASARAALVEYPDPTTLGDPFAPPTPRRRSPTPGQLFCLGVLLPPVGLIYGLSRVFHRDPAQKRLASGSLTGALAGLCVGLLMGTTLYPALLAGQGQTACAAGIQAFQRRDFVKAETEFQRAVELDPTLSVAWINLASLRLQQQKPAEAETAARRAVDLLDNTSRAVGQPNPQYAQLQAHAHGTLASCLALQNDWTGATVEARIALRLAPNHALAPHWRTYRAIEGLNPLATFTFPTTPAHASPPVSR